jgi:hypothetical protein
MHDLGKIGIPDLILTKPAKLDPAEWEIAFLNLKCLRQTWLGVLAEKVSSLSEGTGLNRTRGVKDKISPFQIKFYTFLLYVRPRLA